MKMVYSVDIYNKEGKVVSKVQLNESIFSDSPVNSNLLHEHYLYQISNARASIAHTKTRGEVAGSNKKLFKQKGTGNARAGEKRSPIRRGGGIAFGPRSNRNYSKSMNKKARRLAINGLIALKAKDNEIIGLDMFDVKEMKTKTAISVLKNIGIEKNKILFVMDKRDIIAEKSFKNIANVKYILVDYINPYDLMHYNKILFLQSALEKINK
ncbi:MAG: 50S ribosomal protein L4 [Candidatus Absconditicoccaceae bacterium]